MPTARSAAAVAGAEVFHLRLDQEGEGSRREAQGGPLAARARRRRATLEVVPWDLAQARHVDAVGRPRRVLEEELRGRVTMSPRPVQQAPMRVLTGANMPAALVEMAYLTNPGAGARRRRTTFKNAVAEALYDAIVRFRGYARGAAGAMNSTPRCFRSRAASSCSAAWRGA